MNISMIFRYLDNKYYSEFSSFLEFVKQYSFSEKEINQLDEFGYNLLHYCSMKSNIDSKCTEILLEKKGDMYALSNNEGLTPFEIALRKRNLDILKIYLNHGYDVRKEDSYGFTLLDKFENELLENKDFYEEIINLLISQGLVINLNVINEKQKTVNTSKIVENKISTLILDNPIDKYLNLGDFKALSIHLRTEMENVFFEKLLTKVGKELEVLINNRSLNDLIYDLFNLNMISYEQKEFYITSKNILNHFCHRGDTNNQLVKEFLIKTTQEKEKFFRDLKRNLINL